MRNEVESLPIVQTRIAPPRPDQASPALPRWRSLAAVAVALATLAGPPATSASEARSRSDLEGISYRNDRVPNEPWSIHIVKIERARTEFKLVTTLAQGSVVGLATLTSQVRSLPAELGRPVAAINGDFYRTEREPYAGDPRGLQISQGELVSAPTGGACFWIDAAGNPQLAEVVARFRVTWPNGDSTPMGLNEERYSSSAVLYTPRLGFSTGTSGGRELVLQRDGTNSWLPLQPGRLYTARVREVRDTGDTSISPDTLVLSLGPQLAAKASGVKGGDLLKISTASSPNLADVQTAIGGGPVLLRGGKVQSVDAFRGNERHPRSALGWNDTHFFLVVVDGRQPDLSVGMMLRELALYLAKQGCREAMNLDGGSSAEAWFAGRVVNSPSAHSERRIANGLVVVQKKANDAATPSGR